MRSAAAATRRHAENEYLIARLSMHILEYSLTLSRPCRRLPQSIFHPSSRKSDRRIRTAFRYMFCLGSCFQIAQFGARWATIMVPVGADVSRCGLSTRVCPLLSAACETLHMVLCGGGCHERGQPADACPVEPDAGFLPGVGEVFGCRERMQQVCLAARVAFTVLWHHRDRVIRPCGHSFVTGPVPGAGRAAGMQPDAAGGLDRSGPLAGRWFWPACSGLVWQPTTTAVLTSSTSWRRDG
jgi:hypothetical protein